jgi:hypothetical protein
MFILTLKYMNMKSKILILFIAGFMAVSFNVEAQKKITSPAAKAEGKVGAANITIDYHQPSARERKIMGGLVPYGQVWRTGANNATVFTVDRDIKVEGQRLPKGKYALFTIPNEDEWTIIFNKKHDQWGAFNYNEEDDVLRVKVKPEKTDEFGETFTIDVKDNNVVLFWENTKVNFKVEE